MEFIRQLCYFEYSVRSVCISAFGKNAGSVFSIPWAAMHALMLPDSMGAVFFCGAASSSSSRGGPNLKNRIRWIILLVVLLFCCTISALAATNNHTRQDAVNWILDRKNEKWAKNYDGVEGVQCVDLIKYYLDYLGASQLAGGYAYAYANKNVSACGWSYQALPQPGDIAVWTANHGMAGNNGHVALVSSVGTGTFDYVDVNGNTGKAGSGTIAISDASTFIRPDFNSGSPMITGAGKTIPDGEYEIVVAADPTFRLNITGTNVDIYKRTATPSAVDAFLVTGQSNGFFSILHKGTGKSLDVAGASLDLEATIQIVPYVGNDAQLWSIAQTQTDNIWNGFSIQAKCSGLFLDAYGVFTNNQNVYQWQGNNTKAQGWLFIPYQPSQPVAEGRYVLMSTLDTAFELDPAGNTASVESGTNVRVWNAASCQSRYNSFDFTKLGNGYYKITHAASGLALGVEGGGSVYGQNVALLTADGSDAQQWAVTKSGSGYMLRARSSGYALEVKSNDALSNGINVQQYTPHGGNNQIWKLLQAEYKVTYNANGGSGGPGTQTKYYKTALTLSSTKPTRSGYTFQGWATSSGATTANYQPGASYSSDANLTLYAVWTANQYTATLDPGGGSVSPTSLKVTYAGTYSGLPTPTRTGYVFNGWYTAASGGTKVTVSTKVTTAANHTLYAQWTANRYTIQWVIDGVTTTEMLDYGVTPAHDNPTKEADAQYTYVFAGWSPKLETVTGDATYTAQFDRVVNQYTVTFEASGGSAVPAQTVEYGSRASKPDDPARDGYSFLGWFQADAAAAYDFDAPVTADVTLTARWEEAPGPVSVSGSVSGGRLTYSVFNAPANALLIAVRYDGGCLTEVQTAEVSGDADGTLSLGGSGSVFKLMLVDGRSYVPLCAAWEGTA